MAWRTGFVLTQPNSVRTFTIGPHPVLTTRDVVVAEPSGGGIGTEQVVRFSAPITHQVTIRAIGFPVVQFWGEDIN